MDFSGTMQGAGGVGGLLSVNEGSDSHYPTFDGNGNVSEYINTAGNTVAHYEYDAFGKSVGSGTMKNKFTHQFSTKQLDAESGLHYYGYRYYDPATGRWLGRDPIGQPGSPVWFRMQAAYRELKTQIEKRYESLFSEYDEYLDDEFRMIFKTGYCAELMMLHNILNVDSEMMSGVNLYAFVLNNPIHVIDVLGLDDLPAWCKKIPVIGKLLDWMDKTEDMVEQGDAIEEALDEFNRNPTPENLQKWQDARREGVRRAASATAAGAKVGGTTTSGKPASGAKGLGGGGK